MSTAKIRESEYDPESYSSNSSNGISGKDIPAILRDLKKSKPGNKGGVIVFPKSFLALTRYNLKAAVLLNQIIYWCSYHEKLFYFQEQSGWKEQIGLTLKEVQGAIYRLKDLGLLTTDFHRVNRIVTTFYYPSWTEIQRLAFEYEQEMPDDPGNDKKVIPKKNKKEASAEIDKKVIPEIDKKAVPMEMTKGHFHNYSSGVNYSHGSLIEKQRNNNISTINKGLQQTVEGSTEQQHKVAEVMINNDSQTRHTPKLYSATLKDLPRGCRFSSKHWREHHNVTDLTDFVVSKSPDGVDKYMLPYLKT